MPILRQTLTCKKCGAELDIVDWGDQEFQAEEAWQEATCKCPKCKATSTAYAVYKFAGFEQED